MTITSDFHQRWCAGLSLLFPSPHWNVHSTSPAPVCRLHYSKRWKPSPWISAAVRLINGSEDKSTFQSQKTKKKSQSRIWSDSRCLFLQQVWLCTWPPHRPAQRSASGPFSPPTMLQGSLSSRLLHFCGNLYFTLSLHHCIIVTPVRAQVSRKSKHRLCSFICILHIRSKWGTDEESAQPGFQVCLCVWSVCVWGSVLMSDSHRLTSS